MNTLPARWALLGAYALLSASTQTLWLTYAPVTTDAAAALHVTPAAVGWLSAVFQALYILLSVPLGTQLDRTFRRALGAGAAGVAAGALLRAAAPDSYGTQLAGQLLIALAQPLVVNAVTGLSLRAFPPSERPTVVGVSTASLFLGILAAMVSGPLLMPVGGLRALLLAQAVPAVLAAAALLASLRRLPATPHPAPTPAAPAAGVPARPVTRHPLLWQLGALLFVGYGVFAGLSTWLEPILTGYGLGAHGGTLSALTILACLLGSALLAPLAAARGRSRDLLLGGLLTGAVALSAVAAWHALPWVAAWLIACGALTLSALPAVLDLSAAHIPPAEQGAATGFLMLLANAGALVLVLAMQPVLNTPPWPLLILAATLLLAVPVAARLPGRPR